MTTILRRLLTVLVAVLLVAVPATLAQGAPGGGPGGGGPPEGVGNRPDGVGGGRPDNAGSKKGDIYADLMVVARHEDGRPITVEYTVVAEEGDEETHVCVRPITGTNVDGLDSVLEEYPEAYPTFGWLAGETKAPMFFIPLVGDDAATLDLEPCDVSPGWLADETDLGRLNLGRAPERVLAKQLGDVVDFLDVPEGVVIALDASGRFTQVDGGTGDVIDTIDAPLGNLAAMQSILETGFVAGLMPRVQLSALELAAVQFAAAAPKEETFEPTVDAVQYLGRILNIPKETVWGEVMPVLLGTNYLRPDEFETFLQFPTGFRYKRSEMFPGCIHFYDVTGEYDPAEPGQPGERARTLMSFVFDDLDAEAGGIEGYTQLTADARAVLVADHDLGVTVFGIDDIRTKSGEVPCSDSELEQ